jgi:hypothetical protein
MATGWSTFPIEFRGGLISNMSLLQQGTNAVGSASTLQNFEVDKEGGYKKIRGYEKFTNFTIPGAGDVLGLKVVSNARVIAARKVDAATITERQTATATVNGAISSATALVLDTNTALATVNGAVTNGTTLTLDRLRTFTGVTGTASASGTSATFNITNNAGTYSASINATGTNYAVGETVTVVGANLGGATTANNATVTVTTIGSTTYTNPTQSGYSGSGSSATFSITKTGTSYAVAITAAGSGFSTSETITVVGTQLGGATTANDATITITAVNGSGGITAATIAGTAAAKGPITGVSVAGTGASYGTITKGMIVTGTGITGTAIVKTVTSQNSIILDTSVTVADNVLLSFITNIKVGMQVTGTGISAPCEVSAVTDQDNITLSTAQSLSDNTVLTFGDLLSTDENKTAYYYSDGTRWTFTNVSTNTLGGKVNYAEFNYDGDEKYVFVDGKSYPSIYNSNDNTHTNLTAASTNINTDVIGAERVVIFKNTAFYTKGNKLFFTAPTTVDNFSVADGAGTINLAHNTTGLVVFRDQLIVFTTDTISRLTGSSTADFLLQPITENIGCINGDTVQEIGGDIMYLAPDGLRLLSATDRIGDFALDVASDKIKEDALSFLSGSTAYCSTVFREKSQYRIFSYSSSGSVSSARGLIATKKSAQGAAGIEWSATKGIKANVIDSSYSITNAAETIAFANNDGYAYILDTGTTFDGSAIEAIFQSAFMPIDDPQIRKTFYKAVLFIDPEGTIDLDFGVKYDFESTTRGDILQPDNIDITTTASSVSFFGGAGVTFAASGGATFGGTLEKIYPVNIIGSGDTVALRIADVTSNPSFTLDTCVLEYKRNDRQ